MKVIHPNDLFLRRVNAEFAADVISLVAWFTVVCSIRREPDHFFSEKDFHMRDS